MNSMEKWLLLLVTSPAEHGNQTSFAYLLHSSSQSQLAPSNASYLLQQKEMWV